MRGKPSWRCILWAPMRFIRLFSLALIGTLVVASAVPALATEEAESTGDEVTESVADLDYQPATIVEDGGSAEIDQAWTTKFLVPTGLVIAAVALFSTVVMYFVRVVRTRYKLVE